ncbi:MAG: Beta-glucosidase-related glycosidase, partial [Capsulimonas sp.]|nr:Beta-glucosidase-related glycosidase [Capsulimonas sp.]
MRSTLFSRSKRTVLNGLRGLPLLAAAALLTPTAASAQATFPFQDSKLPVEQRVNDIVSRLTLPEKAAQMVTDAPAIPRLGIPAYYWWSESLHGYAFGGKGFDTVFPEPIGLAATFDLALHAKVANAISDEDRAEFNRNSAVPTPYYGLTFFAPNINIFRDPRWGRGQETYGEDPFLTSQFGVTYIKGFQGDNPKYFKVIATAKHYAVHSGPELERHRFDVAVSAYDLHDTYLPAFKSAVTDGHVYSIMSAYNSLYGVPAPASDLLLQKLLRDQWGFQGYVVSDCGAVTDISTNHKYAPSEEAGSALAVKAGNDLSCGNAYNTLPAAVAQGLISEAEIDKSLKRLFTARMKLGLFDPPADNPYNAIPASVIESPEHRAIALQAARESIVLLKNSKNFLPLSPKIKTIAVIGPNAADTVVEEGNYNGASSHEVSVLEGIQKRAGDAVKVIYDHGSGLLSAYSNSFIPATALSSDGKPGLKGEYFTNLDLSGAPAAIRQDETINFNFVAKPMDAVERENFSVRWTGMLTAPRDANYTLTIRGDDGYRLFIDGKNVAEDWTTHPATSRDYVLPLKAGQPVPIRLEYFQGTGGAEIHLLWHDDAPAFASAVAAAQSADAVIFVGGISGALEGEEGTNGNVDRADLNIPKVQQDLLEALYATKKPIVLVLMNGSALSVNWANDKLPAILDAWYPGEEGGTAVADVLFGDYNPAG